MQYVALKMPRLIDILLLVTIIPWLLRRQLQYEIKMLKYSRRRKGDTMTEQERQDKRRREDSEKAAADLQRANQRTAADLQEQSQRKENHAAGEPQEQKQQKSTVRDTERTQVDIDYRYTMDRLGEYLNRVNGEGQARTQGKEQTKEPTAYERYKARQAELQSKIEERLKAKEMSRTRDMGHER